MCCFIKIIVKNWGPLRYAAHVVEHIFGTKKKTSTIRCFMSGTYLWNTHEKKEKEKKRNINQIKHTSFSLKYLYEKKKKMNPIIS